LRRYKAKRVKTRCYLESVGHLEPRYQGKGSSLGNIFWLLVYKTRHILLSNDANCTVQYVPSFWHNTGVWQTDRRTDRQTDGISIASTAVAMRALRRTVKRWCQWWANPNRGWDLDHDLNPFSDSIWSTKNGFKRPRFDLIFDSRYLRFDSKWIYIVANQLYWHPDYVHKPSKYFYFGCSLMLELNCKFTNWVINNVYMTERSIYYHVVSDNV